MTAFCCAIALRRLRRIIVYKPPFTTSINVLDFPAIPLCWLKQFPNPEALWIRHA
jgi:hypothetical protein